MTGILTFLELYLLTLFWLCFFCINKRHANETDQVEAHMLQTADTSQWQLLGDHKQQLQQMTGEMEEILLTRQKQTQTNGSLSLFESKRLLKSI